ncbi:hypothetical protein [Microbacterium sp. P04]|uniref:hypothetical protein n=1 Tax=Microbacterium sp. P04 TaxID=3366947 RepID=UPI0037463E53
MVVQQHIPAAVSAPRVDTAARPVRFTGSWPTLAAWGAGLIQTALGAGAIVAADSGPLARGVGVVLATLGLLTLAWGAVSLSSARLVIARIALAGATGGVLTMFALLAVSPTRTSVAAVAAGTLLTMIVGAACAGVVRRGVDRPRDTGSLHGIVGMLVAAALIAVIVTPALGATQDAVLLTDDGTVPTVVHDH